MNPVFDELVSCLICEEEQWTSLATVKRSKVTFDLQICSKCGFVAQNPPLSEKYLQNYYENNYVVNNYRNSLDKIHQIVGPANARIEYLRANNYLSKLHRVLEVGPGAGTMMKLLSDHGIDIAGVEPDRAAARWIEENLEIPTFQGFFDTVYEQEKANWYKNLYDGIIITHVLEHISNPIIFLKKLKNIIKQDGFIVIEVPNIERPFSDEWKWETYCDPGHLHYFSKITLEALLYKAGFSVISITDKLFEPFGNLFCIAKIQNNNDRFEPEGSYTNDPKDIKKIWWNFVKYHKLLLLKYKISRINRKINSYKLMKVK